MTRILLIDGHPDPDPARYGHALASAYADGATGAGHALRRVEVADLDFPLLRSQAQYRGEPVLPVIAAIQQDLLWAEHVAIFYPLWLGDVPALFKGFLEQLLRPDFAFRYVEHGFPEPLLQGRSARVVVTMSTPRPIYSWVYRAHSLKSLERNILGFCGLGPVRHTILGSVDGGWTPRKRYLEDMEALGAAAR
jgi:putative NADPH-quinone reductase